MRRRNAVVALVAGCMVVIGLMAVFAVELSNNQSSSRSEIETQAHQRAVLVSGLMEAVFAASGQPDAQLVATYGAPVVSDQLMQRNRGTQEYVALLDADGRVLAHSQGFTAQAAANLTGPSVVSMVGHGEPWALGNLRPYGRHGVINFASRFPTPFGVRTLVKGLSPQALGAFTTSELRKVPGVQGQHQLLVDGTGIVIGSTNPQRPLGYAFHTPSQLRALSHPAGVVKGRYFDQVSLANTTWKLILSVPQAEFFATLGGAKRWLPWLIFAAFALLAVVAVVLARRALGDSQRVREANGQLSEANGDLAQATTQLEETNRELERRASELARSNAELEQFASIASHDLQEPLRKVRTFTERVTETEAGRLSEAGSDYLRRANASAERMQTLIEDLLKYSRVATQGWPFAAVDLAHVTSQVLDDLGEVVTSAQAIVRVGPLPVINADPPQMRQLTQNLLSNAIKFRREDTRLEVDIDATAEDGWMTMVVRDNGIGFDPKYSQRIFRVFERLHGRGTYAGTGIGLALCRKIAARHGGTVEAEGVPGEGSTFTITIRTDLTEAVTDVVAPGETDFALVTDEQPLVTV